MCILLEKKSKYLPDFFLPNPNAIYATCQNQRNISNIYLSDIHNQMFPLYNSHSVFFFAPVHSCK